VFDVEEGRISLTRAHPAILAALPGFTPELVTQVMERRLTHTMTADLNALAASLTGAPRAALIASIPDLQPLIIADPEAWIVSSHATLKGSAVGATVEVKLIRGGRGGIVVRRKETWD
jgi:hypothetical protein